MSGRFEILASAGTDLLAVDLGGGAPRAVLLAPVVAEVADDPARLARLAAEVEACARLFHPHVLAPSALEGFGDGLAVVHPFRDGVTVRELLDAGGRLPPDVAVRIAVDACEGLAHVHGRTGPEDRPLVHGALGARSLLVTPTGATVVAGFCGEAPAGAEPADDLRALGAILYECLAGEPPPEARRPLDAPGVPPALAAAVERALAGERSAEALSRALAQAVAPAGREGTAAYADAIVPADEGARADRRKLVERAAPAPTPPREDRAAAEEVAEDAIVGEPTPIPAPADSLADDAIVGEITPDPSRHRRPSPRPAESSAAPAAPAASAAPAAASVPAAATVPEPAPAPAAAHTRDVSRPAPSPPRRSRAPMAAAVAMVAVGFAAGFALTRWTGAASAGLGTDAAPAAPAALRPPAPAPAPAPAEPAARPLPADPAPAPEPEPEAAPAPARARAPAKPSIAVTADPPGDVYVDGRKVGRSPVTVTVSRGAHEVRLRDRALGIDLRKRVSVRGPDTPVRFAVGKGTLVVTAPDGAEVFLDGRRIGRGDVTVEVLEGNHRIEVRLGEARTGERFHLAPGERWTYEVTPTAPGQ
ncbi:MAG TPA: PEGA domain-containing protein [Anaeromyxobacteraceae bacterium]|nr:PEGA domain-containing protein [Anaeromyxobacteraceae bacterium]